MAFPRSIFLPFALPDTDETEIDEIAEAVRSGWVTTGPKTHQFEQEFAAYVGAKHAIAVNSCTAAMHLALEAIGLRAGDEVGATLAVAPSSRCTWAGKWQIVYNGRSSKVLTPIRNRSPAPCRGGHREAALCFGYYGRWLCLKDLLKGCSFLEKNEFVCSKIKNTWVFVEIWGSLPLLAGFA